MKAAETVPAVVDAYNSGDLARILDLFEPDVVASWNGQKVAGNRQELEAWFRQGPVELARSFRIEKTVQVATDDTVGVHWRHWVTYADGRSFEGFGNEFWTVRNGRAATWNAVGVEIPVDEARAA